MTCPPWAKTRISMQSRNSLRNTDQLKTCQFRLQLASEPEEKEEVEATPEPHVVREVVKEKETVHAFMVKCRIATHGMS